MPKQAKKNKMKQGAPRHYLFIGNFSPDNKRRFKEICRLYGCKQDHAMSILLNSFYAANAADMKAIGKRQDKVTPAQ